MMAQEKPGTALRTLPAALAKAEERFKQLAGEGFTAAVRTKPGEVARINSFNPNAEETIFFARLVGG